MPVPFVGVCRLLYEEENPRKEEHKLAWAPNSRLTSRNGDGTGENAEIAKITNSLECRGSCDRSFGKLFSKECSAAQLNIMLGRCPFRFLPTLPYSVIWLFWLLYSMSLNNLKSSCEEYFIAVYSPELDNNEING